MVVNSNGERFLGVLLSDDVAVQVINDFSRCGDVCEETLGVAASTMLLFEDRLAEFDTFGAYVDVLGPLDEGADFPVTLAAE